MGRFLLVDVGAGTMDVLCYDDDSNHHFKAVVRSPVLTVAEKASAMSGEILVVGCEMGGGPVSRVLEEKARSSRVVMSHSAALTLHHDLERVSASGMELIDDDDAEERRGTGRYAVLTLGDLEPDRLRLIVEGMGIPFSFDVLGVCAQDHGMPPRGVSHLDYRQSVFRTFLDSTPRPDALLFNKESVPPTFNRLKSIAQSAGELSIPEVYVMDSGMAAILGASLDFHARAAANSIVLDVATSHTVAAALEGIEIVGFFEYHTRDVTVERLDLLVRQLADGKLRHDRVITEGGHGAYVRGAPGFESIGAVVATGPRRNLVRGTRLPVIPGAPLGDNMMTGTAGVLEAIRRKKGLESLEGRF
ncbi:MAG: pyruvate formate-lyase activating enzyme [Syntrophobacteraceae bacterium]|nr:pyruvate formate-lyase activating enzyme [Syntrophobacteraceae bacterium]